MTTQPDLFNRCCAEISAQQRDLFEGAGDLSSSKRSPECAEYLVCTELGFLTCPRGQGKLGLEEPPQPTSVDEELSGQIHLIFSMQSSDHVF
jgi:hypothetical protein